VESRWKRSIRKGDGGQERRRNDKIRDKRGRKLEATVKILFHIRHAVRPP